MTFFKKHIDHEELKYKKLFYTYQHRVFIYIGKRITDRENVQDITQNVFVHLWKYRKDLLKTNAEAVIFNTCNQEISKFVNVSKNQAAELTRRCLDQKDDSEDALLAVLDKEGKLERLYANIELLPPLRRKILKMNKLQGITQQEIADMLQLPHHTVKYHVSEALLFLKNRNQIS